MSFNCLYNACDGHDNAIRFRWAQLRVGRTTNYLRAQKHRCDAPNVIINPYTSVHVIPVPQSRNRGKAPKPPFPLPNHHPNELRCYRRINSYLKCNNLVVRCASSMIIFRLVVFCCCCCVDRTELVQSLRADFRGAASQQPQ